MNKYYDALEAILIPNHNVNLESVSTFDNLVEKIKFIVDYCPNQLRPIFFGKDLYLTDKEFNSHNIVYRLHKGNLFSYISNGHVEWDIMSNRLTLLYEHNN